jgi:hypothetical protein
VKKMEKVNMHDADMMQLIKLELFIDPDNPASNSPKTLLS